MLSCNRILFFILLATLLFGGWYFWQNNEDYRLICLENDFCFQVESVKETYERARGLMFRENLEPRAGMLFIFPEQAKHGFWMKNTFIPLDIIWINDEKKVVFIKDNIQPCLEESCPVFMPDESARYVLEINAGMTEEKNIRVGDTLFFR